jgi:hypothetical protein
MTTFINLTPHAITVCLPSSFGSNRYTYEPSGVVARCATIREEVPMVGAFRCVRQTMSNVEGLPERQPGTFFIVSSLVLQALGGFRPDVVAPDTGSDAIRENGHIVAVRGFVC